MISSDGETYDALFLVEDRTVSDCSFPLSPRHRQAGRHVLLPILQLPMQHLSVVLQRGHVGRGGFEVVELLGAGLEVGVCGAVGERLGCCCC